MKRGTVSCVLPPDVLLAPRHCNCGIIDHQVESDGSLRYCADVTNQHGPFIGQCESFKTFKASDGASTHGYFTNCNGGGAVWTNVLTSYLKHLKPLPDGVECGTDWQCASLYCTPTNVCAPNPF